ncbi:hypothetical protein MBANPS3_000709 [Mucor bainieri]
MKQSRKSSKRTRVFVETRSLQLDFCFSAPEDGQTIKKMRMLDPKTHAVETLTRIITTRHDALGPANLTIHHPNDATYARVEEEVDVDGLDAANAASSDVEIDIETVDHEEDKQTKATPITKSKDIAKSVATLRVAKDHHQDKATKASAPELDKTTAKKKPQPAKTQVNQAEEKSQPTKKQANPAEEAQTTSIKKAKKPVLTIPCQLCQEKFARISELPIHYAEAHNMIVPRSAKYPLLKPDPHNVDLYCNMCDKKLKTQITFDCHMQSLHKLDRLPPPIPAQPKEPQVLENLSNKVLSANAEGATKDSAGNPAVQAGNMENAKHIKTAMPDPNVQNAASEFAVKFFLKNGLMNRTVTSPSPPASRPPPPPPAQNPPPPPPPAAAAATPPSLLPPITPAMQGMLLAPPYPDLLDPHNYCKCCNMSFNSRSSYWKHCRRYHTFPLPDPNDPNFFCYVCSLKNPDLFTYQKHMGDVHQMTGFPDMVDIQCYHCSRTFATGKKYSTHLKKVAKWEEEAKEASKRPPPTWNDPSFHCSKCVKTFENDKSYKSHLRSLHSMSASKYQKIVKDAQQALSNQSNAMAVEKQAAHQDHFFCFACRKDFFDQREFDQHLRQTHQLTLTKASIDSLKIAPSPPAFAKPLDPTLYYFMMKDVGQVIYSNQNP